MSTNMKKNPVAAFKSPLHQQVSNYKESSDSLLKEIQELESKLKHKEQQIGDLKNSGYKIEELEDHITKLHEYNEIKDVGQMVLGRIASLDGVRSKDMYKEYGLHICD